MTDRSIELLKKITSPYAYSYEHVQGPGGNTSVKADGKLIIKASGFTFKDVAENNGIVCLNNKDVVDTLLLKAQEFGSTLENPSPSVLGSIPAGLRPSMEFEFHALLKAFVLHTHSVYVNVITCTTECAQLLEKIFEPNEYCLVPYVTPGFPIAEQLVHYATNSHTIPPVIFLQNHGIIVHSDSYKDAVSTYNKVEEKIKNYLGLKKPPLFVADDLNDGTVVIAKNMIMDNKFEFKNVIQNLTVDILIPDQSIFFRNKISTDLEQQPEIYVDNKQEQLVVTGTKKFIEACKAMLQAVSYIKNSMAVLGLTPNFIPIDKLDIIHGLSTEKYRISILKNQ